MNRRFVERGHDVTVVCGSYGAGCTGLSGPFIKGRREGMVKGMRIIEFDLMYSNKLSFVDRTIMFLKYAFRATGVALKLKMDCVLVTTPPLTGALPGMAARFLKGTPFVLEVYDLWPDYPKQMGVIKNPVVLTLISWLEWMSYHRAHRLVAIAPGIEDGIARRGIPRDRITMIHNGCDFGLFEYHPEKTPLPFAIEGVSDSDFIALYTGTHGIANGVDAILDAAAEVKRRGRGDIKFVFAGEGMRKAQLQERARAEDLPVFFLDAMPKVQLVKLLTAADVGLVVLSDFPLFYNSAAPTKFTDYIAAGLPVMMNYPGWLGEKIESTDSGLVVPPGDAVAFANGLVALADDPARARAMGANARALAESDFDRDTLTERFATLIESLQR
ncbi:MAG: glycosyltransferase family 4 protein [Actinobacteria bacterium]|nr:glycosyltransferase family 4 protein [Actinomycetota bacterium]